MPVVYITTEDRDPLQVWRDCREQMQRAGMNPELLELAGDLAAEMREHDQGVPPAVLLARLAARLNGLVVLADGPQVTGGLSEVSGSFMATLIGLAAAELEP